MMTRILGLHTSINLITEREVTGMIKTFIDPEIRKQGRKEGVREGKFEVARNMLALVFEVEVIHGLQD